MRWLVFFVALIGCCSNIGAQMICGPLFDYSDTPAFHIDSVGLSSDTTFVYCTYYAEAKSWANISSKTFIEDIDTKQRYYILNAIGLPYAPDRREFSFDEDCKITMLFPSIANMRRFNIIEVEDENGFNVYNVNLDCKYDTIYTPSILAQYKEAKELCFSYNDTIKALFYAQKIHEASKSLYGIGSEYSFLSLTDIIDIYRDLGRWEDAIHAIDELFSLLPDIEESPQLEYNLLYKKGSYLLNMKKYKDVIPVLLHADSIYNNTDSIIVDYKIHAKSLSMLAYSYYETGDDDNAIKYQRNSLDILKNKQLFHDYYIYQNMLVTIFVASNRTKEGIDYIDEEIKNDIPSMIRNKEGEIQYILYLIAMSKNYYILFDVEKAILYAKQACSLLCNNKDAIEKMHYFMVLSDLGLYYYRFHDTHDVAEKYLNKALSVANEMDSFEEYKDLSSEDFYDYKNGICDIYHRLSDLYNSQNKQELAIQMEIKSGIICKNLGETDLIVNHLRHMSRLMYDNKQYKEAIRYAKQCDTYEANASRNSKFDPHIIMAFSFLEIGDTLSALIAAKKINCSNKIKQSNTFLEGIFAKSYIMFLHKDYKEAEEIVSSALDEIRDYMLTNIEIMSDNQRERIWDRFAPLFFLYRIIVSEGEGNNEAVCKLYDYILFSKSLLLDYYRHGKDNSSSPFTRITWKEIQNKFSNHDIAIEFIRSKTNLTDNYYHALVIDKKCEFPYLIPLFSEEELKQYSLKIKQDKEAGKDLSNENNIIWTPIFERYDEIETIYFSPDDIFNFYNIEMLFVDSDINIYRLSSTKEIVKKHSKPKYKNAVLYGGLEYNNIDTDIIAGTDKKPNILYRELNERGGFDPLYNTFDEVNYVSAILKERGLSTTTYTAGDGTEESFKNLEGKQVNLLHMATHGVYLRPQEIQSKKQLNNWNFLELSNTDNPVMEDISLSHSFLVMSGGNLLSRRDSIAIGKDDGILTAYEVSRLDLRNLDLVVLSACQSALGDNEREGLYGLQRGFKKAGADTIVMSLRNVDDEATKILMMAFYRNLMIGKSKQQSFKDAQKHLRHVENGKYDKPEYWASFIMLDGLN